MWHGVESADGVRLGSIFHQTVWPCDIALVASCERSRHRFRRRRTVEGHLAPRLKCECGIYAAAPGPFAAYFDEYIRGVSGFALRNRRLVVGRVSLWGTVIEHDDGWRASHAFPSDLYVVRGGKGVISTERIVTDLANYRVPVSILDEAGVAEALHHDMTRPVASRPIA
jgi:hypothetical protein